MERDRSGENTAEHGGRASLDAEFIAAASANNEDLDRYLDAQQVRRETLDIVISV